MNNKALGKKINAVRKAAGLTGERLSEKCNINASYLRQLEAGMGTPSLPIFVSLCNELRVSPAYLLAESIPDVELGTIDELNELLCSATPEQLRLVTAMIKAALETM
jgi:transcriptional regulator with XRE-family HTH domain